MTTECRICFENGDHGELISPCACRGTSAFIHIECMKQQFRHQENWILFSCPTCRKPYCGRQALDMGTQRLEEITSEEERALFLVNLGLGYCDSGNKEKNLELCNESLEICEQSELCDNIFSITLKALANAYLELNEKQKGADALERFFSLDSDMFDHETRLKIQRRLLITHYELENHAKGVECFERLDGMVGFGANHEILAIAADMYREVGKLDKVCQVCQRALAIKKSYSVFLLLARTYVLMDEHEKACDAMERAIEIMDEDYMKARMILCVSMMV